MRKAQFIAPTIRQLPQTSTSKMAVTGVLDSVKLTAIKKIITRRQIHINGKAILSAWLDRNLRALTGCGTVFAFSMTVRIEALEREGKNDRDDASCKY